MLSPRRKFFTVLANRVRMLVGGNRFLLCSYLGLGGFENPWLSVCLGHRLNFNLDPFRRLRLYWRMLVPQSIPTLLDLLAFTSKGRYHEGAFIEQAMIPIWFLHQFLALSKHLSLDPYQLWHLILFILVNDGRWCVAQAGHFEMIDGLRHVARTLQTVTIHFQYTLFLALEQRFIVLESQEPDRLLINDFLFFA